jgi:hypothetical protein
MGAIESSLDRYLDGIEAEEQAIDRALEDEALIEEWEAENGPIRDWGDEERYVEWALDGYALEAEAEMLARFGLSG